MKILKALGLLAVLAIALFLFVVNFSAAEHNFQCAGETSDRGSTQPATVFLKQERYRWWVGLWSDSDGNAWIEVPNETVAYYDSVSNSGEFIHFSDYGNKHIGSFSTLSKSLMVSIPAYGVFTGVCKDTGQ